MKLIYSSKKSLNLKQKEFILTSLNNSFPKQSFFFSKNKLFSKNNKNISNLKKSFIKLLKIAENDNKKIIFIQKNSKKFKKNPLPVLQKTKQVIKISDGIFQFQGEFLKIFRSINKYFYNLAINKYQAVDQENPILWPVDLYKKIDYFNDFPQQIMMVSSLKKNFKNYSSFSKKYQQKKKFRNINVDKQFRNSDFGLQPAVCDNCYYALRNVKNYKNTIYTTYNKVFRDEKSSFNNLDRLTSFSVRDIMFVGDEKFVIQTRNRLIGSIKKFLKICKIDCSIEVANDPFFISNINKKIFQDAMDLKYEILAHIPFLRKKIAIGSINFHLNTFGKAFKIYKNKKFIYSGCIGIGFERLLLSFYSQHGTNVKKWPKKLGKIIK